MEARKKRPSGTHCAAMWCNNYVGCRADKISLHRFPKRPTRCAKWLEFCGRRDLLGKSPIDLRHHRVCSDHFIQPYFKLNGSRIALEPYAVPTVLVKGAPGSQDLTDMVAAGSPSLPPLVAEEVCRAVEPNLTDMVAAGSPSLPPLVAEEVCRAVESNLTDMVAAGSPSLPPLVAEEVCLAVEPNLTDMVAAGSPSLPPLVAEEVCRAVEPNLTDMVAAGSSSLPPIVAEEVCRAVKPNLTDMVAAGSPSLPPLVAEKVCRAVEPNVSEMEQECGGDMGTPQKRKSSCDSFSTPKRQRSSGRSNPTPRTENRLRSYKRSISNLRSRLFKCKNLGNTRNKNRMRDIIKASNVYLPESCHKLFVSQLRLTRVNKFGRRWPPHIKDFALSLYYHSPRTYRFMQKTLCLPSVRTFLTSQRKVTVKPGIDNSVLATFKDYSSDLTDADRVVALVIDEIAIKENLHYDPSIDSIVGFCNYGDIQIPKVGRHCLVAMVKGVNKKWKQALGYWVTHDSTDADVLKKVVLDCISRLHDVGYIVKVLTCDQGPHNQSLAQKLGVNYSNPNFFHDHKIYFMYDPPHLLKSMRNNLVKYDFNYDGHIGKWSDFKQLAECEDPLRLKMMPKINKFHSHTKAFQKMKVKYASQVFSRSVSVAMSVFVALGKLDSRASATAEFFEFMDNLFDCFNSSQVNYHTFKYRYAITADSVHNEFLSNASEKFETSNFIGCKRQPACFNGWKLTIKSLLALADGLRNHYGIPKLCTRVLNQDALENMFSVIRQQHGCNDNPTVIQFRRGFKHLMLTTLSKLSQSSNCELDLEQVLVTLNTFIRERPPPSNSVVRSCFLISDLEITHKVDDVEANVTYYVTGFLCKKFLKLHKCETCKSLLTFSGDQVLSQMHQLFIYLKAHEELEAEFGNLTLPTHEVFHAVKSWEEIFQTSFYSFMHIESIGCILKEALKKHQCFQQMKLCSDYAQNSFLECYIRTRIFWAVRFLNQKRQAEKVAVCDRVTTNKLAKVMHL